MFSFFMFLCFGVGSHVESPYCSSFSFFFFFFFFFSLLTCIDGLKNIIRTFQEDQTQNKAAKKKKKNLLQPATTRTLDMRLNPKTEEYEKTNPALYSSLVH
jgi:hypothetical protein